MKKLKDLIVLVKKELIICIAAPVLALVLLRLGAIQVPFFYPIIMMGLFCLFAYGVIKKCFVIVRKAAIQNKPKSTGYRVFVFIVAIIIPVLGLLLNNVAFGESGGAGDFSSIWFYIIAILNGAIMLININESVLSMMLFYLKIVGFTYITYFTIIFVPILPFGFITIMLFGLGVFVFVPVVIFIMELIQILQDIRRLKTKYKTWLTVIIISGVITIPATLFINFSFDRVNFNKALTYLTTNTWEMPTVNITRVESTLKHLDSAHNTQWIDYGFLFFGPNTPFISELYQVVALDDKILSPETTKRLSQIFLGTIDKQPDNSDTNLSQDASLKCVSANTVFDAQNGVYKTWIDLEIESNGHRRMAEYKTEFPLPDGCFISDYYLYDGDERRQGILTDKRAALITYNMISRIMRNPLLYYKTDNTIELRVFPVEPNQVKKTGFLVMHSQSDVITIDGKEIHLTAERAITEPITMQGVSFIPATLKSNLTNTERTPVYYFVIDASENSPYNEHLKNAVKYAEMAGAPHKIYAASYKVYDTGKSIVKCEGGFNLPLAMQMIFKENEKDYNNFPVIIAVSDNIHKAPQFQKSNMAKQFPESKYYYNLGYDLSLTPYSFFDSERRDIVKRPIISKALNYDGYIVADNDKNEIIVNGSFSDYTDNEYHNALILYGKSVVHDDDNGARIELVRDSFGQRVLTKYTAFTVLVSGEQERKLLELQARFLNSIAKTRPQ
ncbi:MAG: MSEP-CTERM sorting domain-containing protein [Synergistaceae bacterium]|nr:MSEP-CTERM sorting domain-containing protein [Synergistaceae bacterium]